jgi:hypothetical protein
MTVHRVVSFFRAIAAAATGTSKGIMNADYSL